MSQKNPKYLNKVMVTTQTVGGSDFTVLYDRKGNKYLKLEKLSIDKNLPIKLDEPDFDTTGFYRLSDMYSAKVLWGLDKRSTKGTDLRLDDHADSTEHE